MRTGDFSFFKDYREQRKNTPCGTVDYVITGFLTYKHTCVLRKWTDKAKLEKMEMKKKKKRKVRERFIHSASSCCVPYKNLRVGGLVQTECIKLLPQSRHEPDIRANTDWRERTNQGGPPRGGDSLAERPKGTQCLFQEQKGGPSGCRRVSRGG